MALTVETGYGLTGADSYAAVADADTYWTARGGNAKWTAATPAQKETALRFASEFVDREAFGGNTPYVDGQGLAFPFEGDGPTLSQIALVRRAVIVLAVVALDGPPSIAAPDAPAILSKTEKIGDLSESTTWAEPVPTGRLWNGMDVSWVIASLQPLSSSGGIVIGHWSRA